MPLNQLVTVKTEQANILADQRGNRLVGSQLHLFTNNITVTRDSVISNFVEAAWAGYAPQTLTNWSAPAELGDSIHSYTQNNDSPSFTNNSGGDQAFYGYFLTTPAGALIAGANSGLVTIPAGAAEVVVVQVTQRSEYTSSP